MNVLLVEMFRANPNRAMNRPGQCRDLLTELARGLNFCRQRKVGRESAVILAGRAEGCPTVRHSVSGGSAWPVADVSLPPDLLVENQQESYHWPEQHPTTIAVAAAALSVTVRR